MMRSSFLALAGSVVVLYALAFVVGLTIDGATHFVIHFALGLCAVVFTLLTHCVVMTYLIASGKMVRLAVDAARLDPDYIVRTKELKAQTFPFMIGAIVLLLAAVLFGAAATNRADIGAVHLVAALLAVGYNTFTFFVEYRIITDHVALNEEVFALHNEARTDRQVREDEGKAPAAT